MSEENNKITLGGDNKQKEQIPKEFIDNEFITPTEEVKLPSKGIFYLNKKDTVKVKYLTAEEDNILFSPELIKSGKVLDALLQKAIVDKDINPNDMIVGDRNTVLIHLRRTGLGEMYQPGKMICPSCGESYEPVVNLNDLQLKWIDVMPDEEGLYDFELPIMKRTIKFRFLNGYDENKIAKALSTTIRKNANGVYKVAQTITERYKLQIMEVEGNKDKFYISKLISAMPMKDSLAFREYVRIISPGIDLNYKFECSHCGHVYEEEVPMTYRLFYPDANL